MEDSLDVVADVDTVGTSGANAEDVCVMHIDGAAEIDVATDVSVVDSVGDVADRTGVSADIEVASADGVADIATGRVVVPSELESDRNWSPTKKVEEKTIPLSTSY